MQFVFLTEEEVNNQETKATPGSLERLCHGDPKGQKVFWQTYFSEISGICRRIVGDVLRADEITVEVLGDFLIRYVHQIENPEAVGSYLRLMAIRRARKEKARADKNVCLPHELGEGGKPFFRTEEAAFHSVCVSRLEKCLRKLRPKARRMLQLSFFKELNHKQIGLLLGSSGQYVGRMINKSLVFLRRCIRFEKLTKKECANELR